MENLETNKRVLKIHENRLISATEALKDTPEYIEVQETKKVIRTLKKAIRVEEAVNTFKPRRYVDDNGFEVTEGIAPDGTYIRTIVGF